MDTVTQQNEKQILKSFYNELKEQNFSLSINEEGEITKITSLDMMLSIPKLTKGMTFNVRKGNYKAKAVFKFRNSQQLGVSCLYTRTDSLAKFLTQTDHLIEQLASKIDNNQFELEKQILINEKAKAKEQLIVQETLDHLRRNSFVIKNKDGSDLDMKATLDLHGQLFDENLNKKWKFTKKTFSLNVFHVEHKQGFITFMPTAGSFVIKKYSRPLSPCINFIFFFMRSKKFELMNE